MAREVRCWVNQDIFDISNKKVISIIGAGGKTSLMFLLAKKLCKNHKVLVTTTTKIYMPQKSQYNYMSIGKSNIQNFIESPNKGIYVLGKMVSKGNKLLGVDCKVLGDLRKYFDYILVEADGSRGKPIKGWSESEPVICNTTDMTIGVIDIKSVGKKATDENVLRLKEFSNLCNITENEKINVDHMVKMILRPTGLFKNAIGEKIIYINKVENSIDKENCWLLVRKLKEINNNIDHIVSGSIKYRKFTLEY